MKDLIKVIGNINLYDVFQVYENERFVIITNDGETKHCMLHNGELFEDVGYEIGIHYSSSDIKINDISMIYKINN